MIRISQWSKAIVEQILTEERKKSKTAGLWESQFEIGVGKLTISSIRIGKPVLMMDV